jgi:hypothetical protein
VPAIQSTALNSLGEILNLNIEILFEVGIF